MLYQWTKVQCHTFFPSKDIKQNEAVDDVINSKIYLQTASKTMTDREKKRGRQKYKKLNISR